MLPVYDIHIAFVTQCSVRHIVFIRLLAAFHSEHHDGRLVELAAVDAERLSFERQVVYGAVHLV